MCRPTGTRNRERSIRAAAEDLVNLEEMLRNSGLQLDPTEARDALDSAFPHASRNTISYSLSNARRRIGVEGPGRGTTERRKPKTR